jgi:hypothetical protein
LEPKANPPFQHSSFHRGVRVRMFPVDWGGDNETTGEFGER